MLSYIFVPIYLLFDAAADSPKPTAQAVGLSMLDGDGDGLELGGATVSITNRWINIVIKIITFILSFSIFSSTIIINLIKKQFVN